MLLSNHARQVYAVHLRHDDIGNDQLNRRTSGLQNFERLTEGGSLENPGAGLGQEPEHGLANHADIVDYQHTAAREGGEQILIGHGAYGERATTGARTSGQRAILERLAL